MENVMTNADRIRSMTDDELVKAICEEIDAVGTCVNLDIVTPTDGHVCDSHCEKCVSKWLKQKYIPKTP